MCEYVVCVCVNFSFVFNACVELSSFFVSMLWVYWCMHMCECYSKWRNVEQVTSTVAAWEGGGLAPYGLTWLTHKTTVPNVQESNCQLLQETKEKILSEPANRKFHLETRESVMRCWPLHFVLVTTNSVILTIISTTNNCTIKHCKVDEWIHVFWAWMVHWGFENSVLGQ